MKAIKDMTDDEVLREAGNLGPDVIGQELFDRAEWIRKNNPKGTLGPEIVGSFGQSASKAAHDQANAEQDKALEAELHRLDAEAAESDDDGPELEGEYKPEFPGDEGPAKKGKRGKKS